MSQWRKGSPTLYFQAKRYFFWLRWTDTTLQVEAVNKKELTVCYKGELRAEDKVLHELYDFLEIHSYRESLSDSKVDEISLIMTIIDRTDEGKGYACRLIFNDSIKEIKVEPAVVSDAYFLTKKIQAIQYEKRNDRMLMAQFGTEITKKLEQKDEDIKKTLTEQIQGFLSAFANQIDQKLDFRDKYKAEADETTLDKMNIKELEKKMKKEIKKKMKERKKKKKHKRIEKKKKRKA